jgi:protein-S-isoprenylcysteine O-methyltransferase Ste14
MTLKFRVVSRIVVGLLCFGLVLFLPAGTLRYWEAWAFLGIWFIPGIFFLVYFLKRDPALVERRLRAREKVKEQKWIMRAAYLAFSVAFLMPGLDFRLGWTNHWLEPVPLWLKLLSLGIVLGAYMAVIWVMDVNRYAARTIQVEAGQTVISIGPYHWIRHPFYSSSIIMMLFIPPALGSWVALPVFALIIPIYVARLLNEEKVLRRELAGYEGYCERTRYRLVPYVW